MLAKEREINAQQTRARDRALQEQESQAKDRSNRNVVIKHEQNAKHAADMIKQEEQTCEKRSSIEKMKASIVYKKNMFKAGQTQHVVTKEVMTETNPYAQRMNDEIHAKTLAARMKTMGGVSGSGKY
jgi:ethanolamine utilization protein EutQ (cupin superfamily)